MFYFWAFTSKGATDNFSRTVSGRRPLEIFVLDQTGSVGHPPLEVLLVRIRELHLDLSVTAALPRYPGAGYPVREPDPFDRLGRLRLVVGRLGRIEELGQGGSCGVAWAWLVAGNLIIHPPRDVLARPDLAILGSEVV